MIRKIIIFVFLLVASVSLLGAQEKARVEVAFNRFYDHHEINEVMHKLNKAYPEITRMELAGKSFQGREMWVFVINNPKTGEELEKPAMWVDGNIHGNELQASETCLYTIWYLLENYGKIDKVTQLVDRAVFYVLPSVNPDGRAAYFARGSGYTRSGQIPTDDDKDYLFDEDPPDDLDKDGSITQMRKKVKFGTHKLDPEDPRLLVRVEPGEVGDYINLGGEGIDNDGDGRINEDGYGGYDPNRNWGFLWMPDYIQGGAGDYPFSLPESKALRDFVINHPNIAGFQSFHNTGGMLLRGPGAKDRGDYPADDLKVYDYLGKLGEEIIPNYKYYIIWKDLYTVYGGSIDWAVSSMGIFAFSNELDFSSREDMDGDGKTDAKERLKFDDYLRMGAGYKEWAPYNHPQYGEIEIGGWTKFVSRLPTSWLLEQTCHRNAAFVIFHADNMPEISIDEVKVKKLKGDLYQVDAWVVNKKIIPTRSAIAVKYGLGRPDLATIEGTNVRVVASGTVKDEFQRAANLVENDPGHLWVPSLKFGPTHLQWLVEGTGEMTLKYDSLKGGSRTAKVTLK